MTRQPATAATSAKPILVTGATGTVGRALVPLLAADGHRVRALVRNPAAPLPPGVEAIRGDLSEPESLAEAAAGVGAVFLVWPLGIEGADKAVSALTASADRVVYLSSAAADEPTRPDGAVERLLERSGVAWTFLRPHGFMANALRWVPEIRATGRVRGAYGAAATAPIHEADLAEIAALALTAVGHEGRTHVLTGPRSLTQTAQISALAAATGQPIAWDEISRTEAARQMSGTGWPHEVIDVVLDYQAARVTDPEAVLPTVEQLTGRPARTFEAWATRHAAAFRR